MRLRPLQGPTRHDPPDNDYPASPEDNLPLSRPEGPPRVQPPGWATSLTVTPKGSHELSYPSRVTEYLTTPKGRQESSRPEGPLECRHRQLSWSFLPLRRLSSGESTPPRLASPGTFRPQGFAPSRRITPRLNVRPCFMPETPMGFLLSRGFPPPPGPSARRRGITLMAFLHRTNIVVDARRPCSTRRNALLGPLPPPGPCSDGESVPAGDCYILGAGRSPPELRLPLQGLALHSQATPHATCAALALRPALASLASRRSAHVRPPMPRRSIQGKPSIVFLGAGGLPRANPRSSSDRQGALQRFRPKARVSAPRSEKYPPEVRGLPAPELPRKATYPVHRRPIGTFGFSGHT